MAQLLDLLAAAIRIATPLAFAAMGGLLSERAGVFAVGLEGMMLMGACGAAAGTAMSGVAGVGLVAAAGGGALLAVAVALVTVRFGADNMVTGIAANILALGLSSFLVRALVAHGGIPHLHFDLLGAVPVPGLSAIPGLGPVLFAQPWLTDLALLLPLPLSWLLRWTQWGLILSATGENPAAVYATGYDPVAVRWGAIMACGALAGLGGAVLVLQQVGTFTDGMTAGRGYLALAAIIVGRWRPWPVLLACLMFGAAEAFALRVQLFALPVSSYVVQMLPYGLALLVLVGLGRSASLPAAAGTVFRREGH